MWVNVDLVKEILRMLHRRDFIKVAGLGIAASAFPGFLRASAREDPDTRPPNFVVIFTDDQGYADVGCFGAKGFTTPNLDRMAREGMRFTNFHVSEAVCSASRASLLTGCYTNRVSVAGCYFPWSKEGLNPEEETIADVLKKKGYATAIFGKWHLGHHKKFMPLQQGFDEYLGVPYSNDMWPVDYTGKPLNQKNKGSKPKKATYPPLPLIDGNEKVAEMMTLEEQDTLTTRYTERAVRFIEKNRDKPFFLYVPHSMPHVPLGVSKKFKGKSEYGKYGDVIMEIDWSVGKILEALKANGLDENTLVIFTSDNGPWLNFGNHAGQAEPLREGKGTSWEGGKRVPCIMRWPGRIPGGATCDRLAATLDILPTLAALAGAPLPERKIDGINVLPLLEGDPDANPRDHFFYYYPAGGKCHQLQAVTDGRWKLHFPHGYRSYEGVKPGKGGAPGPYAKGETGLALFDLKNDIGERHDVKDDHPEIMERLMALGEKARETLGDKDRLGTEMRPAGRLDD
jgi:arylsulfatase